MKYLLHMDLFGRDLKFEENHSLSFKTTIGAMLSILVYIGIISIGILFGREIYLRKVPNISVSQEIRSISRINLNELPLVYTIFSFENLDTSIKTEELFDITMFNPSLNYKNEFNVLNQSFTSTKCSKAKFSNKQGEQDFVTKVTERNLIANPFLPLESYCLNSNENMYIQNSISTIDSSWITLEINKCNQINRDLVGNPIKCNINLEKYLKLNYFLIITFRNSFFDPVDYYNPQKYYEDTLTYKINPGVHNTISHNFVKNLLVTDYSWILEDFDEIEAVTLRSVNNEIGLSQEKLITLKFDSPKMRNKVIRNYLKIQELFAKIGGLFSAFTIIIKVLIYDYVKFKYRLNYTLENAKIEFDKLKITTPIVKKLSIKNDLKILQHNFDKIKDDNDNADKNLNKFNSEDDIEIIDKKNNQNLKSQNFLMKKKDEVKRQETIKQFENKSQSKNEIISKLKEDNIINEHSGEEYYKVLHEILLKLYYAKYLSFRIFSSFKCCKNYKNIGVEYCLSEPNIEKFSFTYYLNKISFIDAK